MKDGSKPHAPHIAEGTGGTQTNQAPSKRKHSLNEGQPQIESGRKQTKRKQSRTKYPSINAHHQPRISTKNNAVKEDSSAPLKNAEAEEINSQADSKHNCTLSNAILPSTKDVLIKAPSFQPEKHEVDPTISQPQPKPEFSLPSALYEQYDVTTMRILSSSKIQKRVAQALRVLSSPPVAEGKRQGIIMMYAKSQTSGKMISIVEIVKREVSEQTHKKWYQYNMLHLVQDEPVFKGQEEKIDANGSKQTATATETIKTPFERAIEGAPKVQPSIIMIICLSRVPIECLKKIWGYAASRVTSRIPAKYHREQTNEIEIRP